jgi:hypothetical protein
MAFRLLPHAHPISGSDSDLQINVRSGFRDVGRLNRVGRRWIATFEAEGRDAFEAPPFTSRKAAVEWMETEASNYADILAATPGNRRFIHVITRNGMYAGDLARLVDVLTEEGWPVVRAIHLDRRKPEYYVADSNEAEKFGYECHIMETKKESRLRWQHFLVEDSGLADRLLREFPKDIDEVTEIVLPRSDISRQTIEEAQSAIAARKSSQAREI